MNVAGGDFQGVQPGDVPVVVARAVGGDDGEVFAVGRPVELVDVEVCRGDGACSARVEVDEGQALLLNFFLDYPNLDRAGLDWAGYTGGVLDEQEGDLLPLRRPARLGQMAGEVRDFANRPAVGRRRYRAEVDLFSPCPREKPNGCHRETRRDRVRHERRCRRRP